MIKTNNYLKAILNEMPRVLSLMDRQPLSPTAGCVDRTYWAWKFVDFPAPRFQEALCVMSYSYSVRVDANPYYKNRQLLEWIKQGLIFWSRLQHRDGSFDEAYPYERSLAATAFTSFYVAEALKFISEDLPESLLDSCMETLIKASEWLLTTDEHHGFLSNHLAAAGAALYHVYLLTERQAFKDRSDYFIQKILSHQSEEGWYEEYGGADPGYQTHGSFYLARYWQLSKDENLARSLVRSMHFLSHFLHPDGSVGGEYASRNTQTYYPAAFEILAGMDATAAWIAHFMKDSSLNGAAAGLRCTDSQNYFPFLNNLVFAHAYSSFDEASEPEDPTPSKGMSWFPQAGLARVRTAWYDAFIGATKGGVVKVFDRANQKLVYSDCGYLGRLKNGRLFSSQYHDPGRVVSAASDCIKLSGLFYEMSRPTMQPFSFALFRLFNITIGRQRWISELLKQLLVKVLIYRKKALEIQFERSIRFGEKDVEVKDKIWGKDGKQVKHLQYTPTFTTIHMGSSRYFINNELEDVSEHSKCSSEVDTSRLGNGVILQRTVSFDH